MVRPQSLRRVLGINKVEGAVFSRQSSPALVLPPVGGFVLSAIYGDVFPWMHPVPDLVLRAVWVDTVPSKFLLPDHSRLLLDSSRADFSPPASLDESQDLKVTEQRKSGPCIELLLRSMAHPPLCKIHLAFQRGAEWPVLFTAMASWSPSSPFPPALHCFVTHTQNLPLVSGQIFSPWGWFQVCGFSFLACTWAFFL